MKLIDKLEYKLGRYAIPNLMAYIIALYVLGYALTILRPEFYWTHLCLDAEAILHGEVWRVVTFLIYPPDLRVMWMVLLSVIYYSLGNTLERVIGTYRFNLYIGIGVFGYVLAALVIYLVWGQVYVMTASNLYLTMLLLMAILFPEAQFYLFFVVPVKAKWLGIAYVAMQFYYILKMNWPGKVAIIMSLLNVIIFFGYIKRPGQAAKQTKRKVVYQSQVNRHANGPRHRCAICGKTDWEYPDMEFRYCSKCEGSYEYCEEHLYTHVHVTGEQKGN